MGDSRESKYKFDCVQRQRREGQGFLKAAQPVKTPNNQMQCVALDRFGTKNRNSYKRQYWDHWGNLNMVAYKMLLYITFLKDEISVVAM